MDRVNKSIQAHKCKLCSWNWEQSKVTRSRLDRRVVGTETGCQLGPHYERLWTSCRGTQRKEETRQDLWHCKIAFVADYNIWNFSLPPYSSFLCAIAFGFHHVICSVLWLSNRANVSRHALYHPQVETCRGNEDFCQTICSCTFARETVCFFSLSHDSGKNHGTEFSFYNHRLHKTHTSWLVVTNVSKEKNQVSAIEITEISRFFVTQYNLVKGD